jgi:hypothetical protein
MKVGGFRTVTPALTVCELDKGYGQCRFGAVARLRPTGDVHAGTSQWRFEVPSCLQWSHRYDLQIARGLQLDDEQRCG